jgi:hypothetical protein
MNLNILKTMYRMTNKMQWIILILIAWTIQCILLVTLYIFNNAEYKNQKLKNQFFKCPFCGEIKQLCFQVHGKWDLYFSDMKHN